MISKEFHQRFCSNRVWVWFPKKDGANSRLWRVPVGLVHRGAAMDGPLRSHGSLRSFDQTDQLMMDCGCAGQHWDSTDIQKRLKNHEDLSYFLRTKHNATHEWINASLVGALIILIRTHHGPCGAYGLRCV
jgi:hypothetical protein